MVARYCAGCHSDRGKAGELSLQGWTPRARTTSRDTTEKMIRKLRAGMMPPSRRAAARARAARAAGRRRSSRGWTRSPAAIPIPAGGRSSA